MELLLEERVNTKKSGVNGLRRNGKIPAIVYAEGGPSVNVSIEESQFQTCLRSIPKGQLATTVFSVKHQKEEFKVIVKQIQYAPVTYRIMHLDLQKFEEQGQYTVRIPVKTKNDDLSKGVKLGGFVSIVNRAVKVSLKGSDLVDYFVIDLQNVDLGETVRVRDLDFKKSMRALIDDHAVLAKVGK